MFRLKTKNYLFLGLVLVLLIFLHYLGWVNMVENSARAVFIPIAAKINKQGIAFKNSYDFFINQKKTAAQYGVCLEKNQNLDLLDAKLKNLEKENAEIRKQIIFFNRRHFAAVTADVIGQSSNGVERMIIISAGSDEGIKPGQPVVVGDGILIGTIAKVEKNIAMTRLINDNQSKIAATILNKDGSLGVVEGGYGLSVKMNFIPRNEMLLIGDKVITSGLEETIPRGLLIGEIAVAENEAYQPFQQAILTTAVDLSKVIIVSVLILN